MFFTENKTDKLQEEVKALKEEVGSLRLLCFKQEEHVRGCHSRIYAMECEIKESVKELQGKVHDLGAWEKQVQDYIVNQTCARMRLDEMDAALKCGQENLRTKVEVLTERLDRIEEGCELGEETIDGYVETRDAFNALKEKFEDYEKLFIALRYLVGPISVTTSNNGVCRDEYESELAAKGYVMAGVRGDEKIWVRRESC